MLDDRFAARLKRLAARLETPPGLRDLVLQAVAADGVTQLRPAFARRRALGWAGAVLAAAASLTLFLNSRGPSDDFALPFVEAARGGLSAGDRGLAAADSLQLADWFAPRLGYQVGIPAIAGAQLMGGRVALVSEVEAAVVLYQLNGEDLTYFALPTPEVRNVRVSDDSQLAAGIENYEVVIWGERGEARALAAAAISRTRLEAIAEECRRASL